jgi:hypothetical protein
MLDLAARAGDVVVVEGIPLHVASSGGPSWPQDPWRISKKDDGHLIGKLRSFNC